MCVCLTKKKKKILSVVESSHISGVWYWEGIYYLLCDINCSMKFCCWSVSVFPYLYPLPLYICVSIEKKKRKILNVVKSSYTVKVWYLERVITCSATLTTSCSFGIGVWLYSLVSSPFLYILCACVFKKKKKKKIVNVVMSSYICKVWYWDGFITYSAIVIAACSFSFCVWVYSHVSSLFPYIYIWVSVCF